MDAQEGAGLPKPPRALVGSLVTRVLPMPRILLSRSTTARRCGRGLDWLHIKINSDPAFPRPVRLGTRTMFYEDELDAYLESLERVTPVPVARLERGKEDKKKRAGAE